MISGAVPSRRRAHRPRSLCDRRLPLDVRARSCMSNIAPKIGEVVRRDRSRTQRLAGLWAERFPLEGGLQADADRRQFHFARFGRPADGAVEVIDQTRLPHAVETRRASDTLGDALQAIAEMWVRGAPLIGVTAACGLAMALRSDRQRPAVLSRRARSIEGASRPTAINLRLGAWTGSFEHLPVSALNPSKDAR